jgi:hypothetical protein
VVEDRRKNGFPEYKLIRLAGEGHIRTWAESLKIGVTRWGGGAVPERFWQQFQFSSPYNWAEGRFRALIDGQLDVELTGVWFSRADVEGYFPKMFAERPEAPKMPKLMKSAKMKSVGGRKPSEAWPDWVAELVARIHEAGIPEGHGATGADRLIKEVADRLEQKGLEAPSRTTVQATVNAVLRRMRDL